MAMIRFWLAPAGAAAAGAVVGFAAGCAAGAVVGAAAAVAPAAGGLVGAAAGADVVGLAGAVGALHATLNSNTIARRTEADWRIIGLPPGSFHAPRPKERGG